MVLGLQPRRELSTVQIHDPVGFDVPHRERRPYHNHGLDPAATTGRRIQGLGEPSARLVLPFPAGPIAGTRWRGSSPWVPSSSTCACPSMSSSQEILTASRLAWLDS